MENFKLIDRAFIDMSNEDLIVLDGPNGFGKTTIFDAIELVLTGKISRIENYNRQLGFNTLLFSKDEKKDSIIKIEFASEFNVITFIKWYTPNIQLQKRDRQPDNWDLFDTYKINNFSDDITQAEEIDQQIIFNLLGINDDLERQYNLYYYIQQEENTHFLKQPGRKRMERINHLFDTHIEQDEQQKIADVRKALMEERNTVKKEIEQSNKKIEVYSGITNLEENEETKYIPLFTDQIEKEWDKKELIMESKEQKDKYIAELMEIDDFVTHYDEFIKARFNKGLIQVTQNKNLLKNSIIASNFLDEYEQIKERYEKGLKFQKIQEDLKKENFLANIREIDFNNIEVDVDFELDIDVIEQLRNSIIIQQNSASELSKVVQQFNDTRKQLLSHFNSVLEKTGDKHGECPFCGYDWDTYERLLAEVEAKRKTFLQYYDDATELVEQKVEELYEKHLNVILNLIKEELEKEKYIVNKDFFLQLKEAIIDGEKIRNFFKWSKVNGIDISSFGNKVFNQQVKDIEIKIQAFSDFLLQNKKEVKEGYSELDNKFKQFEHLYKDTFRESEDLIKRITKEMIIQKKKYINHVFYRQNMERIEKENKNLERLKTIDQKLKEKITELKIIYDVYDSEIRKHWNKVMKDIEIPFYIYSGKIIQEYQKGLGIFIEEDPSGEAKNIKFVSDNQYDHDAINYLSSGQLSALVISFTLALNKVYGNQSLNLILIDDPVQTMDEINMASLTELLRNEFPHKQIIISTHEEDVSRYLRYKFKKYNLKAMRFNVKEDLLLSST